MYNFKPYILLFSVFVVLFLFAACKGNKSKPESKDYTKVKVSDSGHRDSVIDNKSRLYNASIPAPCLQCLVDAVRGTEPLNNYVHSADSSKLVYQVDWSSGPQLRDSLKKAGSGVIIHVIRKSSKPDTIAAFTFNNVDGQLYEVNAGRQKLVGLDSASRSKIRRTCFWGVASSK